MKLALGLALASACAFAAPAFAGGKHYATTYTRDMVVTVSCFRGPWNGVIWDRPNAVFIDSLVALGYDFPTSHAIGERICRDEALVGDLDRLREETRRVIRESPAHSGRPHHGRRHY